MGLERLEGDFQSFVLEGSPDIGQGVVGTARVPVETRLSIYAEAYRARLTEALESNYPVLAKLLGGRQFRELSEQYIAMHRSRHFSIRWYGDVLPALLAEQSPYCERPVLADLARWEWHMTLAFDAGDAPVLEAAALQALTPDEWPELRCRLRPAVQLLTLNTDAPAVWRALNHDEPPPAAALAEHEPQTSTREALPNWIIWRRGLDTFFRPLEPDEACALQAVSRGETFAGVCEALAVVLGDEQAPLAAAQLLAQWVAEEMLAT